MNSNESRKAFRDWILLVGVIIVVMVFLAVCSPMRAETGIASITWTPGKTASGERFDPNGLTAAHPRLPMGAMVRVSRGSKSVVVRINDRGPAQRLRRIIDLTPAAAKAIGMSRALGLAKVTVEPADLLKLALAASASAGRGGLAASAGVSTPATVPIQSTDVSASRIATIHARSDLDYAPDQSGSVAKSIQELADLTNRALTHRRPLSGIQFRVGKRALAVQKRTSEPAEAVPAPFKPGDLSKIVEIDDARRYLVRTATIGGTMARQGADLAIWRLHPVFAVRLAKAISEARAAGINASVFSAYRPPAFGVGGFSDKFNSMHAYGLAVDMAGIGRPGSSTSLAWFRIAGRNKIYNPYGPFHRAEWNHFQPTFARAVARGMALRSTITAAGPKEPERMWKVAEAIIGHKVVTDIPRYVSKKKWKKRWHRKRYRVAMR